ncbi:cell wall-binding repeat-containing protein [Microbacterium gallinarum]|uniref:Cell wall-binding repeat-containing protein n=1 Tax=Microbacterium gallinarum TaxID=2762209 RepID=A0ABR8WYU3_9MICO|nr:cell wall-binding repeat-containing protein [Microbacterium gallinarum]MBD8022255.1 cell wall-binding repeat-containing protein [Microbacterium gallinarum]
MAGADKTGAHASLKTLTGIGLAIAALVIGLVAPAATAAPSGPVEASAAAAPAVGAGGVLTADLTKFQPGNIIGDAVFFNRSAMTEAQIQSFLQAKGPACRAGYTCLKDYYDTSRTVAADAMCGAYSGGVRERASRIIYKVAQACGINPQVLIVMLQKEQGLVTHDWPSEWRYTAAMGQGCPDTAACDTRYYGFFNQVYGGAWQLKRYANPPGTTKFFTWYAPGKTWNLLYNPNRACGTSPVYIQNQATANLYYYTPYQPNAAALRAGYSTGDSCSSYGNRNFYNYFTDWFGSTQYLSFASAPNPTVSGTALAGQVLTASPGTWSPAPTSLSYQWLKGGQPIAGATAASLKVTNDLAGGALSVRVVGKRTAYATETKTSGAVAARGFTVDRLAGSTRYETAVEVSKRANPGTVGTVYLATGADYADALSAASLAAREKGALLLAPVDSLPDVVAAELKRLKPTRVVLIGGHGVLDAGAESRVAAALGATATVERISGVDRYETSRMLAARFGTAPTVYIATGRAFADALGAAAVAGTRGAPVLLVDGVSASLDTAQTTALKTLATKSAIIVGGEGAVSKGIAAQLATLGIASSRYAGADRFATNTALNAASFAATTPRAYMATGFDFPDALTGSVLAAGGSAPLVISAPSCASASAADFLRDRAVTAVTLVGGEGALSAATARLLRC